MLRLSEKRSHIAELISHTIAMRDAKRQDAAILEINCLTQSINEDGAKTRSELSELNQVTRVGFVDMGGKLDRILELVEAGTSVRAEAEVITTQAATQVAQVALEVTEGEDEEEEPPQRRRRPLVERPTLSQWKARAVAAEEKLGNTIAAAEALRLLATTTDHLLQEAVAVSEALELRATTAEQKLQAHLVEHKRKLEARNEGQIQKNAVMKVAKTAKHMDKMMRNDLEYTI